MNEKKTIDELYNHCKTQNASKEEIINTLISDYTPEELAKALVFKFELIQTNNQLLDVMREHCKKYELIKIIVER